MRRGLRFVVRIREDQKVSLFADVFTKSALSPQLFNNWNSLLSPSPSFPPYFFIALFLRAALHYQNAWNRLPPSPSSDLKVPNWPNQQRHPHNVQSMKGLPYTQRPQSQPAVTQLEIALTGSTGNKTNMLKSPRMSKNARDENCWQRMMFREG